MKTERRKLGARFAPETRFEVTPRQIAAPFRALLETEYEKLLTGLLKEVLSQASDPELNLLFRHAANEAGALAGATGFPLLVLPVLFQEKIAAARAYAERQAGIMKQSSVVVGVAA